MYYFLFLPPELPELDRVEDEDPVEDEPLERLTEDPLLLLPLLLFDDEELLLIVEDDEPLFDEPVFVGLV